MNIGMTKAIASQAAKDEIAKVGTGVDNVARTGVNEVKSQLEDITCKYITNIDNSLRHYRSLKYPIITFWGDSITATSVTSSTGGYVFNVRSEVGINKGLKSEGWINPYNGDYETLVEGINKYTFKTRNESSKIFLHQHAYKEIDTDVDVYFAKKEDGGICQIIQVEYGTGNETVLAEVNCNGVSSYGYEKRVTLMAKAKLYCKQKNSSPIYISGFRQYFKDIDGCIINKVAHGGMKLRDYSNDEIDATLLSNKSDLYSFGLGANDSPTTEEQHILFQTQYEYVVKKAREISPNCSILFFIACRGSDKGAINSNFERFKNTMYGVAKKYNCGVIDIDNYWESYQTAFDLGYFSDTIHPSPLGHDSISDLLCKVLIGKGYNPNHYTIDGKSYTETKNSKVTIDYDVDFIKPIQYKYKDTTNNDKSTQYAPFYNIDSTFINISQDYLMNGLMVYQRGVPKWYYNQKWLNPLGYEGNEIRVEVCTTLPTGSSSMAGRMVYVPHNDSTGVLDGKLYIYMCEKSNGHNWHWHCLTEQTCQAPLVSSFPSLDNNKLGMFVIKKDDSTDEQHLYCARRKSDGFLEWKIVF